MNRTLEELEAEALKLSREERGALAHRLIASLGPEDFEDDVEAAWEEEIRHRLEEYRAGRMEAIPAFEAFAKAMARLEK